MEGGGGGGYTVDNVSEPQSACAIMADLIWFLLPWSNRIFKNVRNEKIQFEIFWLKSLNPKPTYHHQNKPVFGKQTFTNIWISLKYLKQNRSGDCNPDYYPCRLQTRLPHQYLVILPLVHQPSITTTALSGIKLIICFSMNMIWGW